ncbi:MAG: type II secretion system F family protein [Selenomonadaceae bacterium]|nr:type II secretion system F family protein [Selenomonadaceae bacterium]
MSSFRYAARTREGSLKRGELEAESVMEAAHFLREQGLIIVALKEAPKTNTLWQSLLTPRRPEQAMLFLRQLSLMLTEQSLGSALSSLAKQPGDSNYRAMLADIAEQVTTGHPLAEALGKHPQVFSSAVRAMIAAGEQSGSLAEIAGKLADHLEEKHVRRQKLQTAMVYPILLLLTVCGAVAVMLFFILPNFLPLFDALQAELPWSTRALLYVGSLAQDHGGEFFLLILLAMVGLIYAGRQPKIKRWLNAWELRLPIWGKFRREALWQEILGTLAILLHSGLRLDLALGLTAPATDNLALQETIKRAMQGVERGYTLSAALAKEPSFPVMLLELVAAGESTGRLEFMLGKSAAYCELAAEHKAARLQAMLEPTLILVLGVIVFFFVLSIVWPLLEAMENMM